MIQQNIIIGDYDFDCVLREFARQNNIELSKSVETEVMNATVCRYVCPSELILMDGEHEQGMLVGLDKINYAFAISVSLQTKNPVYGTMSIMQDMYGGV